MYKFLGSNADREWILVHNTGKESLLLCIFFILQTLKSSKRSLNFAENLMMIFMSAINSSNRTLEDSTIKHTVKFTVNFNWQLRAVQSNRFLCLPWRFSFLPWFGQYDGQQSVRPFVQLMCLGGRLKEYQYADGYHHREDVPQAASNHKHFKWVSVLCLTCNLQQEYH